MIISSENLGTLSYSPAGPLALHTPGSGRSVTLHGVPDGLRPDAPVLEYEGVDPV
jgi:hypothetical protein